MLAVGDGPVEVLVGVLPELAAAQPAREARRVGVGPRRHEPQARGVGCLVRLRDVVRGPGAQPEPGRLDDGECAGLDALRFAVVGGQQVEHQGVVRPAVHLDGLALRPGETETRAAQDSSGGAVPGGAARGELVQTETAVLDRAPRIRDHELERSTDDAPASSVRQEPVAEDAGPAEQRHVEPGEVDPAEQGVGRGVRDGDRQRTPRGAAVPLGQQPRRKGFRRREARRVRGRLGVGLGRHRRGVVVAERTEPEAVALQGGGGQPARGRLHRLAGEEPAGPEVPNGPVDHVGHRAGDAEPSRQATLREP